MKKVNVLGTEYGIITDDSLVIRGCDGECKSYSKEIRIRKADDMLCSGDSAEVKEKRYREVMRHELVHAFFDESGLDEYSNNEQLVTWIASQFPKMLKAFIDVGCADMPEPEAVIQFPGVVTPEDYERFKKYVLEGGVIQC